MHKVISLHDSLFTSISAQLDFEIPKYDIVSLSKERNFNQGTLCCFGIRLDLIHIISHTITIKNRKDTISYSSTYVDLNTNLSCPFLSVENWKVKLA
jgi:hypothetical protein